MEGESRYQIDYGSRDFSSQGHQIALAQCGQFGKTIQTSRELLDLPGIPHRIERIASDSTANDIGHPKDSAMPSKKLGRTLQSTHGTRMAHSTKHLHNRVHGGNLYHAAGKSQIRAEDNEAKLASEREIQGNGVVSMSVY
jgi:hypothetical protein